MLFSLTELSKSPFSEKERWLKRMRGKGLVLQLGKEQIV